ncbi:MAG: DUF6282 family protein [Candidatus Dormiibacterota bacterium]
MAIADPMLQSLEPSAWARQLVVGAYDLHVHVAPDVMARRIDDISLARRSVELGLAGFALKSHYVSTAERAAVVNAAVPGVNALGALTLNAAVGGLNPMAVEIAAREGARIVWMPTVDARNHRAKRDVMPEGASPPMWLALQEELDQKGVTVPPVEVVDERGWLVPQARPVLALVAEHDMVLATGHLSGEEMKVVIEAAREAGVRRIIATHPEFPLEDMSSDEQRGLLAEGVFLERCFTTPFTGKCDWSRMVDNIKATGPANSIVTSDLGQPHNPPVEDGLALMADALRAAGFDDSEITAMIVTNSRKLAGAEELGA